MIGYTLTWRTGALAPADGVWLRADTLGELEPAALAATPIQVGCSSVRLDHLFTIAGSPGPRLTVHNLPPLPRIGAQMKSGELLIEGDAGDDLGASLHGGLIRVRGSAGARVGGPDFTSRRGMTGGVILIAKNAGPHAGLLMRRGLIAVGGSAGPSPGYRMLAGTLVLMRGPLDAPGLLMQRGTIISLDRAFPADSLDFAVEGVFDTTAAPALRLVLRHLAQLGWPVPPAAIDGRYELRTGDPVALNKGELWQWTH